MDRKTIEELANQRYQYLDTLVENFSQIEDTIEAI